MTSAEDTLQIIKNTISTSIRRNTVRGFIGWSSCDNICMDMHGCLDICGEAFAEGAYMTAFEAELYIYVSGVKLASRADSSSGMLTDVVLRAQKMLEACADEIAAQDQASCDRALSMIIRDAKKKAFDGWMDWQYDLLRSGICLCDEKRAKKLEKALDALTESDADKEDDFFTGYRKKEDSLTRYLLHRHLLGREATKAELYEHMDIEECRKLAVEDALADQNYEEAEQLCLDKLKNGQDRYYRSSDPGDWNNILFHVYQQAGDAQNQIRQAKKLLFYGSERHWDILKELYQSAGIWDEQYPKLLDELRDSKKEICYRNVLMAENEKERLLKAVQENPFDLFHYGEFLVKDYPEQVYELCVQEIRESCAQARDRRGYRKAAKQISQLVKWKGTAAAKNLIAELRAEYPRRTALLDELDKVERKI